LFSVPGAADLAALLRQLQPHQNGIVEGLLQAIFDFGPYRIDQDFFVVECPW